MKNLLYTPQWLKILVELKNNQDKDNISIQLKNMEGLVNNYYAIISEMEKVGLILVVPASGRSNKAIIKDMEIIKFIELYEIIFKNYKKIVQEGSKQNE